MNTRASLLAAMMAMLLVVGTSVALATVQTDQDDYSPGSVVTISGDSSNGVTYSEGNTVEVAVTGPTSDAHPDGWTASCSATVDANGAWSCQITLDPDPAVAGGAYTYVATQYDADGNVVSTETGEFTDALGATITSPANNGVYSLATFPGISGTATGGNCNPNCGNYAVDGVQVQIQRTSDSQYWTGSGWTTTVTWLNATGTDSWSYAFTPPNAYGTYTVYARASDTSTTNYSNCTGTCPRSFTIDVTAPSVALFSPSDGSAVGCTGNTTVEATASDSGSGLAKVEFWINGSKAGEDTNSGGGWTLSTNAADYTEGSNSWYAVAVDNAGNRTQSSSTWTLTKSCSAPGSVITSVTVGTAQSPTVDEQVGALTYGTSGVTHYAVAVVGAAGNYTANLSGTLTGYVLDTDNSESAGEFWFENGGGTHITSLAFSGNGSTQNATLFVRSLATTNAGSLPITVTATHSTDSTDTQSDSDTFVIGKANPNCSISGYDGPYTGTAHGASGTCAGVNGEGPLAGLTLGASYTNVPGGTANWSYPGSTNYTSDGGSVDITINPADPDCTVNGYSGLYTGTEHSATLVGCTGVGGSPVAGTFSPGTGYTDVPGGPAVWSFDPDSGNYATVGGSVAITINPANPVCTVNGYDGLYTGTAHGATLDGCTGVLGEDVYGAFDPGTGYTNVPGGSATWSFDPDSDNYATVGGSVDITIEAREGIVAYIGQTLFVTSGSSSTTAQVALSASVWDPDGTVTVEGATVDFYDRTSGKYLARNVPVSIVANSEGGLGTANTIVTLSSGQYGAQSYLIEVRLGTNYTNALQTGAAPGTDAYEAAHATVTVMQPAAMYTTKGHADIDVLDTAAGRYGNATAASYTMGFSYNKKGTNPQGQVQLILERADGVYYVKSNSISSLAFGTSGKDVTIYTKASIYRIDDSGMTSIEGNVTLRVDARDGGTAGDTIGFTVLSAKDGTLFYSNDWRYNTTKKSWSTWQQGVSSTNGCAVVIN